MADSQETWLLRRYTALQTLWDEPVFQDELRLIYKFRLFSQMLFNARYYIKLVVQTYKLPSGMSSTIHNRIIFKSTSKAGLQPPITMVNHALKRWRPSSTPYFDYVEHKADYGRVDESDYRYYLCISPDATPEEIFDFINRYWRKDNDKFEMIKKVKPTAHGKRDFIIYDSYFLRGMKPKAIEEELLGQGFNVAASNISKRISQLKKERETNDSYKYITKFVSEHFAEHPANGDIMDGVDSLQ